MSPGTSSWPRKRGAGWMTWTPAGAPPGGAARVPTALVLRQPARPDAERSTGDEWIAAERTDVLVDGDERRHEVGELRRVELLLGVREGLVRMRMDLDHHAVRAHRGPADRERLHEPALARGMARVHDHGQVGQVVEGVGWEVVAEVGWEVVERGLEVVAGVGLEVEAGVGLEVEDGVGLEVEGWD